MLLAQDGYRIKMSWGEVLFIGNEVVIRSNVPDPPKLRLESIDGSMGGLSWGIVRSDGKSEEMVLIQGKQDERYRGCRPPSQYTGEMTLHLRDGDGTGDGMKLVMRLRHDSLWMLGMPPIGGDVRKCR